MQVINGSRKRLRQPEPAIGSGGNTYRWAERHEIFAAANRVYLDQASSFPFAHFLGLLMLAGMRVEEARRIRWEAPPANGDAWPWPDMKAWEIEIPDPRAGQGHRSIPIIPHLARLLTYWPSPKEGPLFPFKLDDDQIAHCWDETLRLAGVKRIALPALRNTYAAMMQDVFGLSPASVAGILGQPRRFAPKVHSASARYVHRITA